MGVTVTDAAGEHLLRDAELELVESGFGFTEGPVWDRSSGSLIFSDIPGDRMWRWDERSGLQVFREPSHMANGNALDGRGRLVSCEHATSRVTRAEPDGTTTVLADAYQGVELNSPNDVVVASDGSVYFTDPTYGRSADFGVARTAPLGFQGLYRVDPAGTLELLARDFAQPNGLCFSLDERLLYVNDSDRAHIRAFTLDADGRLGGGEVWAEATGRQPGNVDGMKIDRAGNIWCTGPGGIHLFSPDSRQLGVLPVPEVVGNLAWGGDDHRWLWVCASSGLYRIRTEVPGRLPPSAS